MSPELHEMHTLLQQFQDMNQMHDLDHCEAGLWDKAKAAANAATEKAKAAAAAAKAAKDGAVAAHKQHAEDKKIQKDKDTVVQEKWTKMSDADKREVLKVTADSIAISLLTETFFNNPTMKKALQKCIEEYTPKPA